MQKNIKKKTNKKLFLLLFFVHLFLFSFLGLLWHQKMSLINPMTFSSSINIDELKIYNNAKTSCINYDSDMYKEKDKDKTSKKYNTIPLSVYFIVLSCALPILILVIVLFVPSKKITDNLIAFNLDKKQNKKTKLKLGIQNTKSYFENDDDNL